jgi:hypothetical protein
VNLGDGPVFRARVMEEKWDIDFFAGKLYFSRSWTGILGLVGLADKNTRGAALSTVQGPGYGEEHPHLFVF